MDFSLGKPRSTGVEKLVTSEPRQKCSRIVAGSSLNRGGLLRSVAKANWWPVEPEPETRAWPIDHL